MFSDSPENWSSKTFNQSHAVIVAQQIVVGYAAFVDFYGLNKLGDTATFVVDVATTDSYEITPPGVEISANPNYATEGAQASAAFWNNWGSGMTQSPPPGQPAFSASVPANNLITGEFEVIQNFRDPMLISVEVFDGSCSPSSCTPTAVGTEHSHSRGLFPDSGIVITPQIQQDYTARYFDVGTSVKNTCGGPLVGTDETQGVNVIPVYDVGDYGTVEWFTAVFKNVVPSLDWYASPRGGGPMTDAFTGGFFEDGGLNEVCPGIYALPINAGPISSGAIELGSQDNENSGFYFEGLVPGGSTTPIRYTYVPSSTGYSTLQSCVTP